MQKVIKMLIIFDLDDTLIQKDLDLKKLRRFLEDLHKDNILCVLSNSSKASVERKIKEKGLESFFDGVFARKFFFNRKPFSFRYKTIINKFGRDCGVIAVGDKLYTDILGANKMKIKSVFLKSRLSFLDKFLLLFIKPDFHIKTIFELKDILNKFKS